KDSNNILSLFIFLSLHWHLLSVTPHPLAERHLLIFTLPSSLCARDGRILRYIVPES
ncbi:unnamed protein product, partial [Prunus brigantina]